MKRQQLVLVDGFLELLVLKTEYSVLNTNNNMLVFNSKETDLQWSGNGVKLKTEVFDLYVEIFKEFELTPGIWGVSGNWKIEKHVNSWLDSLNGEYKIYYILCEGKIVAYVSIITRTDSIDIISVRGPKIDRYETPMQYSIEVRYYSRLEGDLKKGMLFYILMTNIPDLKTKLKTELGEIIKHFRTVISTQP